MTEQWERAEVRMFISHDRVLATSHVLVDGEVKQSPSLTITYGSTRTLTEACAEVSETMLKLSGLAPL